MFAARYNQPVNIPLYLARLHYRLPVQPDAQTLQGLHRAHMLSVPFENLDIGRKRPIRLHEEVLWDKLIVQGRGGFCYELNGLFAALLKEIGFQVTYLNARVYKEGVPGIDFGHLALLVEVPGIPGHWLADVGFGDSFTEPLNFDAPGEQVQGLRSFWLDKTPDGIVLWRRNYDGSRERQYLFDLTPRRFPADYEAGCHYHQTSPHSSFTRGSLISKATPEGRVTLEEGRLIVTRDGQRSEQPVTGRDKYQAFLKQYFDITFLEEQS